MQVQIEKAKKSKNRSVANPIINHKNNTKQCFGFVDNRLETIVQKKLQKMANNKHPPPIYTTGIEQVANNQVVQCLKGAKGTAQEDKPVPYTLNPDFKTKHVANSIEEAVSVTEARIDTGGPPGIVAGTAPNNLAKEIDWKNALDSSSAIVPPEDEWKCEYGDIDAQWEERLTKVQVEGWEAIGIKGHVTAKKATNNKYLGGQWAVSNCQFDTDENYVDASANVTMDISHLTS